MLRRLFPLFSFLIIALMLSLTFSAKANQTTVTLSVTSLVPSGTSIKDVSSGNWTALPQASRVASTQQIHISQAFVAGYYFSSATASPIVATHPSYTQTHQKTFIFNWVGNPYGVVLLIIRVTNNQIDYKVAGASAKGISSITANDSFMSWEKESYATNTNKNDSGIGLFDIQFQFTLLPPQFSQTTYSINENSQEVQLLATDPENQTLNYQIVANSGDDSNKFSINAQTGKLTFNTSPDYENPQDSDANNIYQLKVVATDSGTPALSTTQTISIQVVNLNEHTPVFTSYPNFAIDENQKSIAQLKATDADSQTNSLIFSISGGADASKFSISPTGVLVFNSTPDYEAPTDIGNSIGNNTYVLIAKVSDNGNPTLVATRQITVEVLDQGINAPLELLAMLGSDALLGTNFTAAMTAANLNNITNVHSATDTNIVFYREYLKKFPNRFANPATAVQVQAMIDSVNSVQPNAQITIYQASSKVSVIATNSSLVQVVVNLTGPHQHLVSYQWQVSSITRISGITELTSQVLTFNATNIPKGSYQLGLVLQGSLANGSTYSKTYNTLLQFANVADYDQDNDGIPDSLDKMPLGLQSRNSTSGYQIVAYSTSATASTASLVVQVGDMAQYFNSNNLSGRDYSAEISSGVNTLLPTDTFSSVTFAYSAGIYNFKVINLPSLVTTVQVIIPLIQAIPQQPAVRKLKKDLTWTDYPLIQSAQGTLGRCQGISNWSEGLTTGHYCIKLILVDGGEYDWDGQVNGQIHDPIGIAQRITPISTTVPFNSPVKTVSGGAVTGGCALTKDHNFGNIDISLLLFLILAILLRYHRRKSSIHQISMIVLLVILLPTIIPVVHAQSSQAAGDGTQKSKKKITTQPSKSIDWQAWYQKILGGGYVGLVAGISQNTPDTSGTDYSVSQDTGLGFGMRLGTQLFNEWQIEMAFLDLGSTRMKYHYGGHSHLKYEQFAIGVNYLPANYLSWHPLMAKIGMAPIVGFGLRHTETIWSNHRQQPDRNIAEYFSIGLQNQYNSLFNYRISYERFSKDSNFLGISLLFNVFNKHKSEPLSQQPLTTTPSVASIENVTDNITTTVQTTNTSATTTTYSTSQVLSAKLEPPSQNKIYYKSSSDELERQDLYQDFLQSHADFMQQHPNLTLYIHGYTDNTGNAEKNKQLARRRARKVAVDLVKLGVKMIRIVPISFGEENPVGDNNTEQGKQLNRRIEFIYK